MLTFTETVLNLTIWSLTGAGLFFGGRAAWRRRQERRNRPSSRPGSEEN